MMIGMHILTAAKIGPSMKDVWHDKFTEEGTTHATSRAFGKEDFAKKRLFQEEVTVNHVCLEKL